MLSSLLRLTRVQGGVHPEYHKDSSAALPIASLALPERLYLPLRQHAGADALPIVKAGDKVLKGQLVALPPTEVSSPIHAPTSGRVVAVEPVVAAHPSGLKALSIVIESDGDDRWIELNCGTDPFSDSPLALADRVAQAGIVGMGGAIFPAAVKLKQGTRHEIKTLLINGSECEPYLTCDDLVMREQADKIVEGARLVRYILNAYRAVIAIEDNKPEAIAAIRQASAGHGMIEVKVVPTRYPTGSAKQLIQQVTGREVPAGERSTTVGVLVHNVGTILAIQQALCEGKPLISRVVTVAGDCVSRPQNVHALMGTPVQELFQACGGLKEQPAQLLMGGPMMGMPLPAAQVPVIKGATGILALKASEIPRSEASPCIRCTRCVSACPMGLLPLEMAVRARADDFDGADEYGVKDCILCGSCAYVCPSHIPLVQYFQYAKSEQDARRSAERKLSYTQELARAREERQAAEAAAKAAAKAAKKAKRQRSAAGAESEQGPVKTDPAPTEKELS